MSIHPKITVESPRHVFTDWHFSETLGRYTTKQEEAELRQKEVSERTKLRDEIALAALPHMLALAVSNQQAAAASYSIADAMLEARNANR